jgi:hypothetical protein
VAASPPFETVDPSDDFVARYLIPILEGLIARADWLPLGPWARYGAADAQLWTAVMPSGTRDLLMGHVDTMKQFLALGRC